MGTTITADQLGLFKSAFPDDAEIQALTLTEVQEHAKNIDIRWDQVPTGTVPRQGAIEPNIANFSECQIAVGALVVDCVCTAFGAVSLSRRVSAATVGSICETLANIDPKWVDLLCAAFNIAVTNAEKATAVFDVLMILKNAGVVGGIVKKILGALDWWEWIIYGAQAIAQIFAVVASGGLAFAAEVALLLLGAAFIALDIYHAVKTCYPNNPLPAPSPAPPVPPPGSVVHTLCNSQGSWQSYIGAVPGQPAPLTFEQLSCASTDLYLHVVGRTVDGQLMHTLRRAADTTWQDSFRVIPGQPSGVTFDMTASTIYQGNLYVLAAGSDGQVYEQIRTPSDSDNGSWLASFSPVSLQSSTGGVEDICVVTYEGAIHLFAAVGGSEATQHSVLINGSWAAWQTVSAPSTPLDFMTTLASTAQTDQLSVLGVGQQDNQVWEGLFDASTGQWVEWTPAMSAPPNGQTEDAMEVVGAGYAQWLWLFVRDQVGEIFYSTTPDPTTWPQNTALTSQIAGSSVSYSAITAFLCPSRTLHLVMLS